MRRGTSISRLTALAATLTAIGAVAPATAPAATEKAPSVSTGGVNNIRGSQATLNGTVNPNGGETTYFFQYGPTIAYGSESKTEKLPAGLETKKVGVIVTGLQLGWHYRIVAENAFGEAPSVGKDRTFEVHASHLKITLNKPTGQHLVGGSIVLSGQIAGTGSANHQVVLQDSPYPYTAPFVNVGSDVTAGPTGRFSITASHLSESAEYRVATVDPRPVYSSPQTVLVAPKVTLHVRLSSKRGVVRLYGTVSPSENGAKVVFQLEKPLKNKIFKTEKAEERAEERGPHYVSQFGTTAKRATSTLSRFSSRVTITRAGRYRAYLVLKKGPLVSGWSNSIVLKAAPSKHKHHHK